MHVRVDAIDPPHHCTTLQKEALDSRFEEQVEGFLEPYDLEGVSTRDINGVLCAPDGETGTGKLIDLCCGVESEEV